MLINKTIKVTTFLLGLSFSGLIAQTTITPKSRTSHEELLKKREATAQKATEKPKFIPKKRTLIGNSTLLFDGKYWTLIPKGSVIVIPDRLKNKTVSKPSGTLIEWKKFLARNGTWLHVHPIKMTQAQGKDPLNPDKFKKLQSINKIVVATCANGPISVSNEALPKEEETK